jgi:RimJ/RimL family protein N-acetyltransferase
MLPATFTPFSTDRLRMRLMTTADVDDVHSYESRPDVCAYLPYEPRSREVVAERIERYGKAVTLADDDDYWQIAIETPATPDAAARVVGSIYFTVRSIESLGAAIGWVLHPDVHGRGYAREAASAMLDIAFGQLDLHRVIAELDPRNDASIALCTRLGMREEALFVKDLMFRGEWADTGIYAILQDEWHARRAVTER